MDPRLNDIDLKTSLSAIADMLMPRECTVCGRKLIPHESHICAQCLADMPLTRFERLAHNPMADCFNARISSDRYEPYAYAAALYVYSHDALYRRISQALKYRRNFGAGRFFAAMLGKRLASSPLFADVDAVVPVPLHWTRRLRRGYNQSEVIAQEIAAALSNARCSQAVGTGRSPEADPAPLMRPELLVRVRRTRTQTRLSVEEKQANVSGAFRAAGAPLRPKSVRHDAPLHILLVDDVFTTGATMEQCYRVLRSVYPPEQTRISIATLAYVEALM